MTDLPHFGYVFKKPKIVNSTHSLMSVTRYDFRKTYWTDLETKIKSGHSGPKKELFPLLSAQ